MSTLFLWITLGCQPTADLNKDTQVTEFIGCTEESSLQLWERLGSPISTDETTPVAPSLLVVDDELRLYLSLRDNLNDTVVLTRSLDGRSWSDPIQISGLRSQSIKHLNVLHTQDSSSFCRRWNPCSSRQLRRNHLGRPLTM